MKEFRKIINVMLHEGKLIHHERLTGWKDDLASEAYVMWLETGYSKGMCVRRAYDKYANKLRMYANKGRATVLPSYDVLSLVTAQTALVPENIDNAARNKKWQERFESLKPLLNKDEIKIIDMLLDNKKIEYITTTLGICERTICRFVDKIAKRFRGIQ